MFKTISLVILKDDAEADRLIASAKDIYGRDPNIKRLEIARGMKLLDHPLAPQASYSIVMEFDDENGWRQFRAGQPHDDFQAVSMSQLQTMIATQYVPGD